MFLEGFVEGMESGTWNGESFQILTCLSIPSLFVENHFVFTIFFSSVTFNYIILSKKSQKFRSLSLI